jgi:hypothetical protein
MLATSAPTSMISVERDSLPNRGYELFTFTNRRVDRSVSGVISRKGKFGGYCLNLRAADLTEEQLKAIFKAIGQSLPQL